MSAILLTGDATDLLPVIPAGSVQCSITSPPLQAERTTGVQRLLPLEGV